MNCTHALSPQPHNARLLYVPCQKSPIYTQKSQRSPLYPLAPPRHRHCHSHTTPACAMCVVKRALFTRKRALLKEPSLPTYALLPPPLPHNAHPLYVCCENGPYLHAKESKESFHKSPFHPLAPSRHCHCHTKPACPVCVAKRSLFVNVCLLCRKTGTYDTHVNSKLPRISNSQLYSSLIWTI